MTLPIAAIAADARARWQRDGALLWPLAGLLVLVPQWALLLFVPEAPARPVATDDAGAAAWQQAMAAWLSGWGGWYLLATLLGYLATLTIAGLYCAPAHPTLGRALGAGSTLVWRYLLATLIVAVPLATVGVMLIHLPLGAFLLLPVVLVVLARTALVAPVLHAERPVSAGRALLRSWRLTRGATAAMAVLYTAPPLVGLATGSVFTAAAASLTARNLANPVVLALFDGAAALVETGAAVAMALVAVSAYRRLAAR